jgi:hypothetical protein
MRVSVLAALAACTLVAAPACKKKEETKTEPTAADTRPADPTAADPRPADPPAADDMLNDMKNCPNAVAGAETKVEVDKTALNVTITGKDDAATAEIRARSHKLLHGARPAGPEVKHTGEGTGGGALGKCPAMIPGATATVADVDGGVKISYAADAAKLADMKKQVEDRVQGMPKDPSAGPPADPAKP